MTLLRDILRSRLYYLFKVAKPLQRHSLDRLAVRISTHGHTIRTYPVLIRPAPQNYIEMRAFTKRADHPEIEILLSSTPTLKPIRWGRLIPERSVRFWQEYIDPLEYGHAAFLGILPKTVQR